MIKLILRKILLCCNPTIDRLRVLQYVHSGSSFIPIHCRRLFVINMLWLYNFETTVECSTLLFSLGTYIPFPSLFLEHYKDFSKSVVLFVNSHLYLIYIMHNFGPLFVFNYIEK